MTAEQWATEAALVLATFHRIALAFGLLLFVITLIRRWTALGTLAGPVGQVINAVLSGIAIPEATFPLYWIVWQARPISDISAGWLEIYVYIGAMLMILFGLIGIREALK